MGSIWRDLAERIYRKFMRECTEWGEVMIEEEGAITIIEKEIKKFVDERRIGEKK